MRVGGEPASNADFIDVVYGSFPLMIALIAVTTFILLARAFRSLLLPAKAILLNVLSVAAAWGVMVLVWQEGYGSELIWGIPVGGVVADGPGGLFVEVELLGGEVAVDDGVRHVADDRTPERRVVADRRVDDLGGRATHRRTAAAGRRARRQLPG